MTVLPKIADLSIDGSDTLFEVLSQGIKLPEADDKKYLGKPNADRSDWCFCTTNPGGKIIQRLERFG